MIAEYQVCVIGAGPAGLAVSSLFVQKMKERKVDERQVKKRKKNDHIILEEKSFAGGTYAVAAPEMPLLSPVFFNSLPLIRYRPKGRKNNVKNYLQYLQGYILKIRPEIKFKTRIRKVSLHESGYRLESANGDFYLCDKLVVATGMSGFPKKLKFKIPAKLEVQTGLQWKGSEYYKGKNILIVGSGTSALEMAVLLADKANVFLAAYQPLRVIPLFFGGLNFHWIIRILELLPKQIFPMVCDGRFHEPAINQKIKAVIRSGKVRPVDPDNIKFTGNAIAMGDGRQQPLDILINCTGYTYNTDILPAGVKRHENGNVMTRKNESVSHPGLFLIGHPCSGGIDSKFLRGIYRDAKRIIKQLEK